jgi:uncharacterized protein (TIGR00730 family)
MTKIISVFGSSAPQPGSAAFEEARQLGRLLAEAGFAVATGGYSGTMKAVSQGASEAGGHVIGVTSAQIEQFRPLGVNQWVAEEIKYESFRDRLMHLVLNNNGMITLPGGIGTLSEMSLAWSFLQVGEVNPRPLALLGDMWRDGIRGFYRQDYVQRVYLDLLFFADSPEMAVAHMVRHVKRD